MEVVFSVGETVVAQRELLVKNFPSREQHRNMYII